MFDFEKKANANNVGKTKEQIHVEEVFRKFGEKTGSFVLEIEERVTAKNRKPVFKHVSEFFEFCFDERGAVLNVLTDAGDYYLLLWTCGGNDLSIYYIAKSEIDLPECAFKNIQLYKNLSGGSIILTPIVKNFEKKYALYVPNKTKSDQISEFVQRFPPVEKQAKQKAVKKDDDSAQDSNYRDFFSNIPSF